MHKMHSLSSVLLKTAALFAGIFFAFFALPVLSFLGTAAVLLLAEYPLIGVTIAVIGWALILTSLVLWMFSIVFLPQKVTIRVKERAKHA